MKTKMISLALLSLGVCTITWASDYKSPSIGFKETTPPVKEMKVAEFNETYKVEEAVKTDRQIASEKEPSEREPSSVTHEAKIDDVDADKDEKFTPKPWLYRNKVDSAF
jgi:hypothetical protein